MGNDTACLKADIIHPLSRWQRLHSLCYGYIRIEWQASKNKSLFNTEIPNDLCKICQTFVGIDGVSIKSATEIKREKEAEEIRIKQEKERAKHADILQMDPSMMTPRQVRTIQTELSRQQTINQKLEMELYLREQQIEEMEENFRLVSDQSKMIGIRAMEQEQQLIEYQKALQLTTKQLSFYKKSKEDEIYLNEYGIFPMHLRDRFNQFLHAVFLSQCEFLKQALKQFVMEQITDNELRDNNGHYVETLRQEILTEINKIGKTLFDDYINEVELTMNGVFSSTSIDVNYTLLSH